MNKKITLAIAMSLAVYGSSALAVGEPTDPVTIDFDGAGGTNGNVEVGSLDWAVGSSMSSGGAQASEDWVLQDLSGPGVTCADTVTGCNFDLYTHAALQGAADIDGNPIGINDLNTTDGFEWTFTAATTERISNVTNTEGIDSGFDATINGNTYDVLRDVSSTTFEFNDSTLMFEVYYDDYTSGAGSTRSSILEGTGFDDGQLILSSSELTDISGTFASTVATYADVDGSGDYTSGDILVGVDNFGQTVDFYALLDSFGVDNWADEPAAGDTTYSVTGTGATSLEANSDFQDFNFIKDALAVILSDIVFSTQNVLPFLETNPSFCYDSQAGTTGPDICLQDAEIDISDMNNLTARLADGTIVTLTAGDFVNGADPASEAAINDCVAAGGSQLDCFLQNRSNTVDVLFQTDANQAFRVDNIPEPGMIALLGMGMGLMGLNGIRRRRSVKA